MFTVKILSSEEFDKLPFKHAKEALGAADPSTNIAYVRDTGYNDITKHTIEHELDELMQKASPHEIDGIRYKIPVIGPLFSAIGSGASALGSGIGNVAGSIGSVAGKIPGIGGALNAGISGAGNLLGKGVGLLGAGASKIGSLGGGPNDIFGFGGGSSPSVPKLAGSLRDGGIGDLTNFPGLGGTVEPSRILRQTSGGGVLDFFKGAGTNLLKGAAGNFASGGGGGIPGFPNTPPIIPQQQGEDEGSLLDNIFKKIGEVGVPALAGLIGDRLAPDPGELDVSGITGSLRDRITGADPSSLFAAGERELLQDLSDPTVGPPPEAFTAADNVIEEDLANQIENLRNEFKRLNPNANVENNSQFLAEKSRLEERARERRAAVRDEASFGFVREQLTRDLQEIQTALGVDSSQTDQLIRLAQLDAQALAINYGLSLQEAAEFKQLFGQFGELLVT